MYEDVEWAAKDPIIASKLQQMADNDSYIQQQVDNKMPKGILAAAKRVTPFSFSDVGAGGTDVPGLEVSFTVPDARILKVTFYLRSCSSTVGNTQFSMRIFEGGTLWAERVSQIVPLGTGSAGGAAQALAIPAAGTYTLHSNMAIVLFDSAPTMTIDASETQPGFLLVEDIGSSSGISVSET